MLVSDTLRGGLRQVQAAAIKAGAVKAAALPVSGAFHTPLMEPARAALVKVGCPGRSVSVAALPTTLSSS
jgi:malonyl CoA-acyl carrier protein transacylase